MQNSSQQVSSGQASSSQAGVPGVPQNLSATPRNASVTLNWSAAANAESYHVYYATEANIQAQNIAAFDNGTWLQNVTPPYEITSLVNGETYYFVVTAVNGAIESAQSAEVSATPSAVDVARQPTAQEVLMLELINRARFDPPAEATRYEIGLNDGLNPGSISADRKPPLAHNLLLIDAARTHSQWMLDADIFSHDGEGGNSMVDRMRNAGYVFSGSWAAGENIAWSGGSGSNINLTEAIYGHHRGLFRSAGHRQNILSTSFREIGVGHRDGYFLSNGTNWRASMITENFARSGSNYFLTGVVYNDTNGDDFYNVGEGLSGITITVNGQSHAVFSTGAYSIPVVNASYAITISGAELGSSVNYNVNVNGANVKLDVIRSGNSVEVVSW